jgi:hypothetical protein
MSHNFSKFKTRIKFEELMDVKKKERKFNDT